MRNACAEMRVFVIRLHSPLPSSLVQKHTHKSLESQGAWLKNHWSHLFKWRDWGPDWRHTCSSSNTSRKQLEPEPSPGLPGRHLCCCPPCHLCPSLLRCQLQGPLRWCSLQRTSPPPHPVSPSPWEATQEPPTLGASSWKQMYRPPVTRQTVSEPRASPLQAAHAGASESRGTGRLPRKHTHTHAEASESRRLPQKHHTHRHTHTHTYIHTNGPLNPGTRRLPWKHHTHMHI